MAVENTRSRVVGRDTELEQLHASLRRARGGHGTAWFITGELGSGKQTLVDELERRSREDPELDGAFFAGAACSREASAASPYEPFAWLLLDLVEQDRATRRWNAIFGAVRDVAPDWLGMVP